MRLRQLSGFTFALQRFDFLGMLRPQVLRLSGCCAYSCPFAYSLSTGKRCCLNGQPKQCESQHPSAPQKNWKTPQPGKAPAGSTHGLLSIPGFIKGSLEWSPLAGALLLQGFYKDSYKESFERPLCAQGSIRVRCRVPATQPFRHLGNLGTRDDGFAAADFKEPPDLFQPPVLYGLGLGFRLSELVGFKALAVWGLGFGNGIFPREAYFLGFGPANDFWLLGSGTSTCVSLRC